MPPLFLNKGAMKLIIERFALKNQEPITEVSYWQKAGTGLVVEDDPRARELVGQEGKFVLIQIENWLGDGSLLQQHQTEGDGMLVPFDSEYYGLFNFPLAQGVELTSKENFEVKKDKKIKKEKKDREDLELEESQRLDKGRKARKRALLKLRDLGLDEEEALAITGS